VQCILLCQKNENSDSLMVRFESKKRLEGLSWSQMAAAVCEKAAVAFPIFIDPIHRSNALYTAVSIR
jgi:hypothetical protein